MDGLCIGRYEAEAAARSRMDLPDCHPRFRGVAAAFHQNRPDVQLRRRGRPKDNI